MPTTFARFLPLALLCAAVPLPITPAQGQVQVADGVLLVGIMEHFAISEASGLVASRRHPNVIWTHNDGGDQFLFALTPTGEWMGAFQVIGANLIDWEAIAPDDEGNLYLADIGIDGMARSHVAVHRVKEPQPAQGSGNAEVSRSWYLRFPVLREDCEAFFVLDGFGYLLTKPRVDGMVTLYRYPLSSRANSILLEEVTKIPVEGSVTDAALSLDRQRLGLVTGAGAHLLYINGRPETAASARQEFSPLRNEFIEGGSFLDAGFLVNAETRELLLFTNGGFRCMVPAGFAHPLADQSVLVGSQVRLDPEAVGCPQPTFTWSFNGQPIVGQTNATLLLSAVVPSDSGLYEILASNALAVTTSAALVTVRSKPNVRITEVMPSPSLDASVPTADWWELTSFETQPVDLSGWRFNDSVGLLSDPYVLGSGPSTGSGQAPILAPGESIVFVETLTRQEFVTWWGVTNLPPGLQIVSYTGSGLSFRITGDTLHLWDAFSTDPVDTVARADFGTATSGVTFNYAPDTQQFGILSQLGVHGVIRSASGSDLGSPGRIAAPDGNPVAPPARLLIFAGLESNRVRIEFEAAAGFSYWLDAAQALAGETWTPTGDFFRATTNGPAHFEQERTAATQFYRLRITASP